jgi:hypothetical protein
LTRRLGNPHSAIAALAATGWVQRAGRRNLVLFADRLHPLVRPLFTSLGANAFRIQHLSNLVVGHMLRQFSNPCH